MFKRKKFTLKKNIKPFLFYILLYIYILIYIFYSQSLKILIFKYKINNFL